MLERYYKKNYVIAAIAITTVVFSSFTTEGLSAAPLSFSSIQKSATETKTTKIKPLPSAKDDNSEEQKNSSEKTDTTNTKDGSTAVVKDTKDGSTAVKSTDTKTTKNNKNSNTKTKITKIQTQKQQKTTKNKNSNVTTNTLKSIKPTTIDRLTPSQQLLKESNKMFNTMAEIEQKNALLQLELDHQKLLTEILNVKIAKEKIEEEEAERKRKVEAQKNSARYNPQANMIFRQTVTPTKPEPKSFSVTNNDKDKTQPIQQQMYNGNSNLGTMQLPPNGNQQQQQIASNQPQAAPYKPEPPKKKTTYSVSFIEGVAGKLKGVLKTSSGQKISVEEGDTLSTGHTVVAVEMSKVILEKDGKKEVIPVK